MAKTIILLLLKKKKNNNKKGAESSRGHVVMELGFCPASYDSHASM